MTDAVIPVLLVDDHAVVRQGLRWALQDAPDVVVAGEAGDGRAALAEVRRVGPRVVVTDLDMPRMDGHELLAQLTRDHPEVAVLILTVSADPATVRRTLAAGASGYVLKDASPEEIVAAVRRAADGDLAVSASVGSLIARQMGREEDQTPSERELEVLRLVATGATNAQVASALFVSESTVRTYLRRVFVKLGVQDRTSAALLAVSRGLIEPPSPRG